MLVDQSQYILKSCDAQDHVTAHFIHTNGPFTSGFVPFSILFHFPCIYDIWWLCSDGGDSSTRVMWLSNNI